VSVRRFKQSDFHEWIRMRRALWPHVTLAECRKDWSVVQRKPSRFVIFVSERRNGRLQGFLEASLRDYAENCDTSPVGYIEGWYVDRDARRQGAGRKLVRAAERWARSKGCKQMASDAEVDNKLSYAVHRAFKYVEGHTCIHFHKTLR
jgi:aminoglycoside 6'-N-acetyltransferase I